MKMNRTAEQRFRFSDAPGALEQCAKPDVCFCRSGPTRQVAAKLYFLVMPGGLGFGQSLTRRLPLGLFGARGNERCEQLLQRIDQHSGHRGTAVARSW